MKHNNITEGDYLVLTDNTYCRVIKSWHGKNNAWLVVNYRNELGANMERSVELFEVREIAPEPYTDPE